MPAIRNFYLSCLALGTLVYAQQSDQSNTSAPTVTIDSGSIRGRTTQLPDVGTVVNQFLGIPFAQPPVGTLRFEAPREVEPWTEVLDATSQPDACIQYLGREGPGRDMRMLLFNNPPVASENEDCLYLNVYAPEGGETNKPVLFWIHGGSGYMGSAALPMYDGSSIAANHDIIVVATNYRLNVFGQPRAPGIPIENAALGQLDTNLALEWTAQNIQQFGGDPSKITIMGESAGAISVGNIVNTFPENPPFRAAIEMSGSSVVRPINLGGTVADASWPALVELLNCTDTSDAGTLECVRAAPAETIKRIIEENEIIFSEAPHNNITSLERPALAWAERNVAKVPLLIGYTGDDGSVFVQSIIALAEASNLTITDIFSTLPLPEEVKQVLIGMYGPDSPYASEFTSTREAIIAFATDITFGCTSSFVANITSNLLDVPVWQYMFDSIVPSQSFPQYPELGVWHSSELPLLFGTYLRDNATAVDASVSQSIQSHFANFIRDPQQGPGWDQWPQVGVLGVADGNAVTTTQDVNQLDPICQQYHQLWLATEMSPLAQAAVQNTTEGAVPNAASRAFSSTELSLIGGLILFMATFV